MKKLRRQVEPTRIRFFHCGEYGEEFHRPHYHALIFGYQFPDLKYYQKSPSGHPIYSSQMLNDIWGKGFAWVGHVTYQSAAYVARYIFKKVTGDEAFEHYWYVDKETGETKQLSPEYTTMSNRPGIGAKWFDKYKNEVFPDDFIIMDGKKRKVPRYYAKLYERLSKQKHDNVKAKRIREAQKRNDNSTPERLAVRETVKTAQISKLKRTYEEA